MKLIVHTDGSITGGAWGKKKGPKTTPHGWSGWWVEVEGRGYFCHQSLDLGEAPYMTGNVAEYMALRSALAYLVNRGLTDWEVEVVADSQLLIYQMDGSYNCHQPVLRILFDECQKLAARFARVTYRWVRREDNRAADVLSKGFQIWGRVPEWGEVEEYLGGPVPAHQERRRDHR